MAYTPELNMDDSAALRRIAWSLGLPMTKTLAKIIDLAVKEKNYYRVCYACKDRSKCKTCKFKERKSC